MQDEFLFKWFQEEITKSKHKFFNMPAEPEELPPAESLGKLIKTMRLTRAMTQPELAKILNISKQHLQKWEYGICKPSQKNLRKLLYVLRYKSAKDVICKYYV